MHPEDSRIITDVCGYLGRGSITVNEYGQATGIQCEYD